MLRDKPDRDRELELARKIEGRASRYKRGTNDDLDCIESWAIELRERLQQRAEEGGQWNKY